MPTVLVDARNVLRSEWPNIPEERVVELCRRWAEHHDAEALIVFDGQAPGGVLERRALDDRCAVAGSGAESADDFIVREAAALASGGRPYWLVTSDRELRRRAGGDAERTIGGGAFARELRTFPA